MASYQHTTAACLHIRKCMAFFFFLRTFLCLNKLFEAIQQSRSFVSSPEFHWSGTTLKSFLKEKHALPSWQRRLKQVPRTRPVRLWKMMSALRRRSILL